MRTFTLLFSALVLGTTAIKAQTVADFESLPLASADTYYVNTSAFGNDVGVNNGLAHFPYVCDTPYGPSFPVVYGFVYSNKADSVHDGYMNPYSAKAGTGYGGSNKYSVLACLNPVTFEYNFGMNLNGAAIGRKVNGFYITNTTYAYNSMAPGYPAQFPAKKFDSGDWFMLTIKGYSVGVVKPDSVNFYLADYRASDSTLHYVLKTWEWVNLLPLGNIDSLGFSMSSSDTSGGFGMNTPAYFCMDNFNTNETNVGVANIAIAAKVYPNPAKDILFVDLTDEVVKELTVIDAAGRIVTATEVNDKHIEINTGTLSVGVYTLQLRGANGIATVKFTKQ